jgi:FkbM family methyltransferase
MTTQLSDGLVVHCLRSSEAKVLDNHVSGYFRNGITLQPNSTVIDVGANVGVFAVRAVTRYPGSVCYAFEPVPAIFGALQENANRYPGIVPLQMGAGKEKGELRFTYYPNSPALSTAYPEVWENDPESLAQATISNVRNAPKEFWYARYLPEFICRMIAKRMRQGGVEVNAPITTVSAIMTQHDLSGLDLLKVDCEGAEYDVLLGIENYHWPLIKQVVVEVYNLDNRLDKITALLKEKGFSQVTVEEEDAMRASNLYNVYAIK